MWHHVKAADFRRRPRRFSDRRLNVQYPNTHDTFYSILPTTALSYILQRIIGNGVVFVSKRAISPDGSARRERDSNSRACQIVYPLRADLRKP